MDGSRPKARRACCICAPRVSSGIDEKFELSHSFEASLGSGWLPVSVPDGLEVGEDLLALTPDGRRQLNQSAELADGIDRRHLIQDLSDPELMGEVQIPPLENGSTFVYDGIHTKHGSPATAKRYT